MENLVSVSWIITDAILNSLVNGFRQLLILIDTIVYGFVEVVLQLIIDLANVEIFAESTINEFSGRIYVILGLVMVFKVIFSFIQILINPDNFNDKEKGVGNVLIRVVTALVLIVLVPFIFDMARQLQNYVIPVIPRVLIGESLPEGEDESIGNSISQSNVGQYMAWYSFLPFFTYNDGVDDGSISSPTSPPTNPEVDIYSVATAAQYVNRKCTNGEYCYNYSFIVSTAVGIYLLYVLVNIAVNIAIRAIKLGVCEFVAPIPIASYVDAKQSKTTFDNWVKTSVKVYFDLFIQLIIVYFVIFVFQTVFKTENIAKISENLGGDGLRTFLVYLLIIVGLLQFAKQAPKFLSDMLSIKSDGSLSSIFKPDGWKAIGQTLATPAGATVAATGNFLNAKRTHQGVKRMIGSAAAGLTSGLFNGSRAVLSGKGGKEVFRTAYQKPIKTRQIRELDKANNVGFFDRTKVRLEDTLGLDSAASLSEGKLKAYGRQRGYIKTLKGNFNTALEKYGTKIDMQRTAADAANSFIDLLENNQNNIRAGNSIELKNILDKFIDKETGKRKKNPDKFTYGDILAARIAAQQSGSGGAEIARSLSDSNEFMKGIQKKLWGASLRGQVFDSDNNRVEELDATNIGAESKLDSDIKNTLSQIRGAMAEDILALNGDNKFKIADKDVLNSEVLYAKFSENFSKFDDVLSNAENEERAVVATSDDAAARASIQRRKSN